MELQSESDLCEGSIRERQKERVPGGGTRFLATEVAGLDGRECISCTGPYMPAGEGLAVSQQ